MALTPEQRAALLADPGNPFMVAAPTQEQAPTFLKTLTAPEGGVLPAVGGLIANAIASPGGRARDLALDYASGAAGAAEGALGLADLATGGATSGVTQALRERLNEGQRLLAQGYSEARKGEEQQIEAAEGFFDTAVTMLANPQATLGRIVQSAPSMLVAGGVGNVALRAALPRAVKAAEAAGLAKNTPAFDAFVAKRAAAYATAGGAVGEGAIGAGGIAAQAQAEGRAWGEYAAPAAAGGLVTAAIGGVAGRVGAKLGAGDVEGALAQRMLRSEGRMGAASEALAPAGGLRARVLRGGAQEGTEELLQSTNEAIAQNLALGKPWDENLGAQAAQGLVTGFGMGAGLGAVTKRPQMEAQPEAPAQTDSATENAVESDLTKLEKAVDILRGTPPEATAEAIQAQDTVDGAIEAANQMLDTASPVSERVAEVRAQKQARAQEIIDQQLERAQAPERIDGTITKADIERRRAERQAAAQAAIDQQLAQDQGASVAPAGPGRTQATPAPELEQRRVERQAAAQAAIDQQLGRAPAAPAAPAIEQLTPQQKQQVARARLQQPGPLRAPGALTPVQEAAAAVQTAPATTQGQVDAVGQQARFDAALRTPAPISPVAAVAQGVQTAPGTTQADVLRMAQQAQTQVPRAASARETQEARLGTANEQQQNRAVDDIVQAVAPQVQFSPSATLRQVSERLKTLGMPPLTTEQRARIIRSVSSAGAFVPGPPQQPAQAPAVDRNADNAAMEARIPVKRSAQRTTPFDPDTVTPLGSAQIKALPEQRDASARMTRNEYRLARAITRLFGRRLVVYEASAQSDPDGFVYTDDRGAVHLRVDSGQSPLIVLGHEILHRVKVESEPLYRAIMETVRVKQGADTDVAGVNGDMEELTADLVGNLFGQPDFWLDVMSRMQTSQAAEVGNILSRVIDRITKALGGLKGYETGELVDNLTQVRDAASQALAQFLDQDIAKAPKMSQQRQEQAEVVEARKRVSALRSLLKCLKG